MKGRPLSYVNDREFKDLAAVEAFHHEKPTLVSVLLAMFPGEQVTSV